MLVVVRYSRGGGEERVSGAQGIWGGNKTTL